MTAYPITLKTRTAIPKTGYAYVAIDATADTALAAITTSSTVGDVIGVLNACIARALVTDSNSIGLATNVQTGNGPTDIALSAAALAASTAGNVTPVTIGTLTATSAAGGSMTFALVAGAGDTDNANYDIVALNQTSAQLRYIGTGETAGSNSVRVKVTDSEGQSYQEAFTITVS